MATKTSNPDFRAVVEGTLLRLMSKNVLPTDKFNVAFTTIYSGMVPQYFSQGDFTVATLQNVNTNDIMAIGVSKRNPTDNRLPLRGRSLALNRAVVAFVTKVVLKAVAVEAPVVAAAKPIAFMPPDLIASVIKASS